MYYPNQFFYPYTIYSPQQCICQSPQSAINEQVAQMNMNTRLQMMQMEQCIQSQIPHMNFPSYTPVATGSLYKSTYIGTEGYIGSGAHGYIGGGGAGICVTRNLLDGKMTHYSSKKESWIEKLDKLIFPIDPIRGWVESEIERISKKYAWIDNA